MTQPTAAPQGHLRASALVVPLIVVVIVLAGVVPSIRSAASKPTASETTASEPTAGAPAEGDAAAYASDGEATRFANLAAMTTGAGRVAIENRPWWPAQARATRAATPEAATEPAIGETTRLVIPAIDVDASVVGVGQRADGSLDVPDFGLAGWYTPGPMPGSPGPAVIAAHVDSRSGPDVFFRLRELEPGDVITVLDEAGESVDFVVEHREQTPKDALPVDRIWNDTDEPVLRLITCGGDFDRSVRSYRSNVIVYASKA